MKKYGIFQAMFMSFYSKNLYRDVAKQWGADVVLYLFVLLLICWGVLMFKYQPIINTSFRVMANQVVPQIPEVTIKNGILTTPENRPYLIKDNDNSLVAIIDTSGTYSDMNNLPEGTGILITKDTNYYRDKSNNWRVSKIPQNLNLTIEPEKIKTVAFKFVNWLWVLLLPLFLLASLVYRLLQGLIYAVIGKIFAAMARVPLFYSQVLKIAYIAVTPAIVLATITDLLGIYIHMEWFACYLLINL